MLFGHLILQGGDPGIIQRAILAGEHVAAYLDRNTVELPIDDWLLTIILCVSFHWRLLGFRLGVFCRLSSSAVRLRTRRRAGICTELSLF